MIDEAIAKALEVLKKGGVILYPTDTVWGIGCDATNPSAVEKIFALKKREDRKSMIVLTDRIDNVSLYVQKVPEVAWELLEVATSPLTLVLPEARGVAENLVPEEGTLAIRVPDHEFCRRLIYKLRRPLVSTSANLSGGKTPSRLSDVPVEIISGVDYAVPESAEGRPTRRPSSILSVGPGGEIDILRQ